MSYQVIWFRDAAKRLKLLEPNLAFESLIDIVNTHLPRLAGTLVSQGSDLNNPEAWWQGLGMDAMLRLERKCGKVERVAVCLASNWPQGQEALKIVQSRSLKAVRLDMAIDRHWVIVAPSSRPYPDYIWVDFFYAVIDRQPGYRGCSLLEVPSG
ncbi:hypothetical protein GS597_16150 [Synechococcales cyanobacterium C]|uniref:Uncharacterized protein n=1 Tax=Petrachloros mirabilis ULC683 TaxID=2781853 RepID=A0A8K1ZZ51_9CYAN|nr:hypothetical protein [Petrachloros mirabilis]NCJ08010.1 hypothetical protein [Petrachloros mirabilis ULC683]